MTIKPIFLSLLLLAAVSSAHAFFTDSLVTGDANTLRISADFDWTSYREDPVGYGRSGQLTGSWEGGTYILSGNMNVLPLSPIEIEVRVAFSLRTLWNDGYDPGFLGDYSIGTSWLRGMWSSNDPTLAGFGLVNFVLNPDYSGTGSTTWELSRTPVNVPDSGSTLLLLGIAVIGMFCPHCGKEFKARWTNITQKDLTQRGEVEFGDWERNEIHWMAEKEPTSEPMKSSATPDERHT